jgi:hypothetical protein
MQINKRVEKKYCLFIEDREEYLVSEIGSGYLVEIMAAR